MRAMTAIAIRFIQHYKAILNASPGSCRLNERSAKTRIFFVRRERKRRNSGALPRISDDVWRKKDHFRASSEERGSFPKLHRSFLPQALRCKQQPLINAVARFDTDNARLLQPCFGPLANPHGQHRITIGKQLHQAPLVRIVFFANILATAIPQAGTRL